MCKNLTLLFSLIFLSSNLFSLSNGDISGFVKTINDVPIENAYVFIENTSLGTRTDSLGFYRIKSIPSSKYNLIASALGFEKKYIFNVIIKSTANQEYNFVLNESKNKIGEVRIKSSKFKNNIETPLSIQSLSASEIANYPGSNNDVVRVAQSLPGVSPSIGGFRNDLIIRGGAPNETVYYLDGVEIPNINHFSTQGSSGGPVGLLNVSFIEDVTLSTSAFAAKYDNPLSGVLQFKQRNGNREKLNLNFRLSASEAAITAEGPLFKKNLERSNTSFIASVRRSYLDFLFKLIELPIRPNYWDYQYKITHKINDYNEISILGVGSIDEFSVASLDNFDANQKAFQEQAPYIEQNSNTIGVSWKRRFKKNNGSFLLTLSNNNFNNEFTRYEDNINKTGELFKNQANENETKLRFDYNLFINSWKLNFGSNQQYSNYSNTTTDNVNSNFYQTKISFIKYGIYANISNSFFDNKLDVSFGFRMDDDSYLNSNILNTFSPRASFSYKLIDNLSINGSLGRYFKIPPYTILGFRDNTRSLLNQNADYIISNHIVLGLEKKLSPYAKVSLEGFYKFYENYPVSVLDNVSLANKGAGFEVLGNEKIQSIGKGRAYGIELLAQQKFYKNFFGIFSYTLFNSEFSGFDNIYLPSTWDSRHLISVTSGYKFNKNWEISARFRFSGETPFAPIDTDKSLANYPVLSFDYAGLVNNRLSTFSQIDARVDKKWNFKKFSLNVFFEVQNLLGQTIPQIPEYGLSRDVNGNIQNPRSLVPLQNLNKQVIPSIGVVLDI